VPHHGNKHNRSVPLPSYANPTYIFFLRYLPSSSNCQTSSIPEPHKTYTLTQASIARSTAGIFRQVHHRRLDMMPGYVFLPHSLLSVITSPLFAGDDPFREAVDMWCGSTATWNDPQQASTRIGNLVFTMVSTATPDAQYAFFPCGFLIS
jgi:hypothetical protein